MGSSKTSNDVIVFAGGDLVAPYRSWLLERLPTDAWCVAADSGLHQADALGISVDLLVGDLDSVDPIRLDQALADGIPVERHPIDKDQTDLELALARARQRGADRLYLVGGGGGRLDHLIANLAVLCHPDMRALAVIGLLPPATVHVVTSTTQLVGEPGEMVSLIALLGTVRGVTTTGLTFGLHNATLEAGSARGVSNTFAAHSASVGVSHGSLLVIQPGDTPPALQ